MADAARRIGDWLLRRSLPAGDRGDSIRGDLIEEWRRRGMTRPASRWYARQAIEIALCYGWRREPRSTVHLERRAHMSVLDAVRQDVRHAVRSFVKAPAFFGVVLTTLALGIGASTAIFSMVNGVILRPLPLPQPDRLAFINELGPTGTGVSVSWPNYLDWRARARSFEGLASSRTELLTLTGVERPQRLEARRVSGNFLRVLGVAPIAGRGFEDADDRAGAEPVVVLSDEFWRSQFGRDPAAVGRLLALDGRPHRVVGILPPGFRYNKPYALFVSMGPHADALCAQERSVDVGAALAVSRWVQALLVGVTATDPATFAAVVAMLLAIATIACCIPAWRATRVDP